MNNFLILKQNKIQREHRFNLENLINTDELDKGHQWYTVFWNIYYMVIEEKRFKLKNGIKLNFIYE